MWLFWSLERRGGMVLWFMGDLRRFGARCMWDVCAMRGFEMRWDEMSEWVSDVEIGNEIWEESLHDMIQSVNLFHSRRDARHCFRHVFLLLGLRSWWIFLTTLTLNVSKARPQKKTLPWLNYIYLSIYLSTQLLIFSSFVSLNHTVKSPNIPSHPIAPDPQTPFLTIPHHTPPHSSGHSPFPSFQSSSEMSIHKKPINSLLGYQAGISVPCQARLWCAVMRMVWPIGWWARFGLV